MCQFRVQKEFNTTTEVRGSDNVKTMLIRWSPKSAKYPASIKGQMIAFVVKSWTVCPLRVALEWHRVGWHWWHWSITMLQCLWKREKHKHCDIVIGQCHQCHPTLCHPSVILTSIGNFYGTPANYGVPVLLL